MKTKSVKPKKSKILSKAEIKGKIQEKFHNDVSEQIMKELMECMNKTKGEK